MPRGSSKASKSDAQTSLFDEATLAASAQLTQSQQVAVAPPPVPPPPVPPATEHDGRSSAVWRQWLSSMANDAEAALAAAIAYREMDGAGREKWLSSLEFDAPQVDVPGVALYAPLLAVEQDPERRERLLFALSNSPSPPLGEAEKVAFTGIGKGTRVYVVATPLYLDFVQILACGVRDGVFEWVRHDPIVGSTAIPVKGDILEGILLEPAPMKAVLDELAMNVLSHQRAGQALPEALSVLVDLLGPLGP